MLQCVQPSVCCLSVPLSDSVQFAIERWWYVRVATSDRLFVFVCFLVLRQSFIYRVHDRCLLPDQPELASGERAILSQ